MNPEASFQLVLYVTMLIEYADSEYDFFTNVYTIYSHVMKSKN